MESYDVVIVGAGIAGTGLAHSLHEECPEKSVLVIEKNELGSNAGHNVRVTFENVIKNHGIPFIHEYKGIKMGFQDEVYFNIEKKMYAVDYRDACSHLLKESGAVLKKEHAMDAGKKTLTTNKSKYGFNFLVDCSGPAFFLRKKLGMPLPFRYWIANLKVLKENSFGLDYLYYMFGEDSFIEEINPLKNSVSYGLWQYSKKVDFRLIRPHGNLLAKKHSINLDGYETRLLCCPVAPALPLVHKNFAFVGDSFGNSPSSCCFGFGVALDTAKMLAEAIKENNLMKYEKDWKKKYLESYIRFLVHKFDSYNNSSFMRGIKNYPSADTVLEKFKKYPEIYYNIFENPTLNVELPSDIKKLFPKKKILFQAYYYLMLKLKYLYQDVLW
ncbi:hypothetical protein JXA85_03945 [Candidatus Woesearchaeota archaeon]|nr:hypothetical protein [Candidatus Woesearchaeota archaeon]